ncbi:MAG: GTP cyclohydrolase I FolE [FCB group bacterium]|nr:GTP cyclohydrolase I FolE [FCB group bacterium]
MEELYKQLLIKCGEDINREGLKETPQRAAEAFRYLTKGYKENIDEIVKNAIFESDSTGIVLVKNIELYSLCEHHLLPFIGKCHVGYIPNGKVIGFSEVAMIVDAFARRLQIQENLTRQIAATIEKYTNAKGVAVVIEAQHLCMMMRGVEKHNAVMKTSCLLGKFQKDSSARAEFFSLLK